jgi:hypothetical protein
MFTILRRLMSVLVVLYSGLLMGQAADVGRLEGSLSGAAGGGDISGNIDFRQEGGRERISVEVEGFTPGESLDVVVDGITVGRVSIDTFGRGDLNFDTTAQPNDLDLPFPADFPNVGAGSVVMVGPLSGEIGVRFDRPADGPAPPAPAPDPGGPADPATPGGDLPGAQPLPEAERVRLRTRLLGGTGAGDVSGQADFRIERGREKFSVEVEGFGPGEQLDVQVDGLSVGTITIDSFGRGHLDFDTTAQPNDLDVPFPDDFPAINQSSVITVGPLSGGLALRDVRGVRTNSNGGVARDRAGRRGRGGERDDRAERRDRGDRRDKGGRPDRTDRADRPERADRVERPERADRVERPERADRVERPERADRVERPERADRVERPERIDRPERAERAERPERPERSNRN